MLPDQLMWIKEFVPFAFLLSAFSFSHQKSMFPAFIPNFKLLKTCWSSLQSLLRQLSDFFVFSAASPSTPFLSNDFTRKLCVLVLIFSPQLALVHMFAFFFCSSVVVFLKKADRATHRKGSVVCCAGGLFNNMLHCVLTAVLKSYQVSLKPPSIC